MLFDNEENNTENIYKSVLYASIARRIGEGDLMEKSINYEKDTLNAYRSRKRAEEYKRYHTKKWSWGRFSTWMEQRIIAKELARYNWRPDDVLLDIPCGTGILGRTLKNFPFKILASDISPEMMELAREEYPTDRLIDCVQADITKTDFARSSFACIVVAGFMHRVPLEIKRATLKEIYEISKNIVIVTCSIDSPLQRIKRLALALFKGNNFSAPCPMKFNTLISEFQAVGFEVVRSFMVVPFFSSDTVFILEKRSH